MSRPPTESAANVSTSPTLSRAQLPQACRSGEQPAGSGQPGSEVLPFWSRAWFVVLAVSMAAAGATACGGPQQVAAPDEVDSEPTSSTQSSADATEYEAEGDEPEAPPDPCADGSCAPCGDTVCLKGFFCDEAAGACSWVPSCAEEPDCGCLEKELSGCSCAERDGGLYVQCSD